MKRTIALSLVAWTTACGSSEDTTQGVSGPDPNGDGPSDVAGPTGPGIPSAASLKHLRSWEYENSIRDLVGQPVTQELPEDLVRANFSSVSATLDCFADATIETFEASALDLAQTTPLGACAPQSGADECISAFIASFARLAWRRPPTDAEVSKYTALASTLTDIWDGDAQTGLRYTVAALLQSPYFLYRVELGKPTQSGLLAYDPFEMATRLSYMLWETTPDETLLSAAEAGELSTAESVRAHALRLLADPRSESALARFWSEHLNTDRLSTRYYAKAGFENAELEALYAALREEGYYRARKLNEPGANALDFLTYTTAYVNDVSAAYYGITTPVGAEFRELPLPPERLGYTTSGVFLATQAHPSLTSPTRRGNLVLDRILCTPVPPPPDNVPVIPETTEGSRRMKLSMHVEHASCAACHKALDGIGFAFEGFDSVGRVQTEDSGYPVDTTGSFTPKGGAEIQVANAAELAPLLRDAPTTAACLVEHGLQYFGGHLLSSAQEPYVEQLTAEFSTAGHQFREFVAAALSSDAFRFANGQLGEVTPEPASEP